MEEEKKQETNVIDKAKEGLDDIINIFTKLKMSINHFKESLFDLQSDSRKVIYTKMSSALKTALTKKLNEHTSIVFFIISVKWFLSISY